MKPTARLAFIITLSLYSGALFIGYALITLVTSEPQKTQGKVVPVTLTMFQSAAPALATTTTPVKPPAPKKPQEKPPLPPVDTPPPVVKPIEKPLDTPKSLTPKAKPMALPKVMPKPTPVKPPKTKETPAKPVEQTTPEISPPPEPESEPTPAPTITSVKQKFSAQQSAAVENAYLNALRNEILIHAQDTYPKRAKRRHWEGVVSLQFTLVASGEIQDLKIVHSSGRQILDQAAMDLFQQKMNNRFKPFPKQIQRQQWRITVPVSYHLD